jgi:hypothetical protein
MMTRYWWLNLYSEASAVVKACENCSRAKAAFIHRPTELELNPVPIKSMSYRRGLTSQVTFLPPLEETATLWCASNTGARW